MKQICAWCGNELTWEHSLNDIEVSYGICLPCANSVIKDIPNRLNDFLDMIPVPVVLVDYSGTVKTANGKACCMLGKILSQVEGETAGVVFQCAYALLPGGCGNTYHCSGCTIRRTVMNTFATGEGLYRVPASLKQSTPTAQEDITFLITTEKFDDYVMLKIYGEGYE